MAKSAKTYFYEFTTNADADVAMSLLRSQQAFLHLALMAAHLGDGQIADGLTLTARMDEDLVDLPLRPTCKGEHTAAEKLLRQWVERRWVHRSLNPDTKAERYQLTSGASQAVRQMRNLEQHTSTATESALALVMAELRQLATAANPDPAVRARAIEEQIALLTSQLEMLAAGHVPVVNPTELIDKIAALVQLIERIPTDLARYGEQMHDNTAALLKQSLSDDPSGFADTLAKMFEGHDVIAASPEGLAFRAFANLLGDPGQRNQIEEDIGELLIRVHRLPPHLAEALSGFIDAMWNRMLEVEDVRRSAFRRMSIFVRGGDALHYRGMRTRVAEAQAAASEAFQATHPATGTGFVIPMSAVVTESVGRWRLDEGTATAPDAVEDSNDEFIIDPTALAGTESIDWVALRTAIHSALEAHGGYATLPEVLGQMSEPRTGDVIGIWSLAARYGDVDDSVSETVWAHTRRGLREITVPYLVFAEAIPTSTSPKPARRMLNLPAMAPLILEGAADA